LVGNDRIRTTPGGHPPDLGESDLQTFRNRIIDSAGVFDCITGSEVLKLAFAICVQRFINVAEMLSVMKIEAYFPNQENMRQEQQPMRDQLLDAYGQLGMKTWKQHTLEIAWRFCCNGPDIGRSFPKFTGAFQRDGCFIFNADETQLNIAKQFGVLWQQEKLPLSTASTKLPHISTFVTS
jgi:hypothetical protein